MDLVGQEGNYQVKVKGQTIGYIALIASQGAYAWTFAVENVRNSPRYGMVPQFGCYVLPDEFTDKHMQRAVAYCRRRIEQEWEAWLMRRGILPRVKKSRGRPVSEKKANTIKMLANRIQRAHERSELASDEDYVRYQRYTGANLRPLAH